MDRGEIKKIFSKELDKALGKKFLNSNKGWGELELNGVEYVVIVKKPFMKAMERLWFSIEKYMKSADKQGGKINDKIFSYANWMY